MIVKLVGNKKIFKMTLPDTVGGDYWLCDNSDNEEQKLVNIKSLNGTWIVASNKYSKIINEQYVKKEKDGFRIISSSQTVIKEVGLDYNKKILISLRNDDELYALYCFPTYETRIKTYKIANNEILIGSSEKNDIMIMDNLIKNCHARIYLKNGRWFLENYDDLFGTYLNNEFVDIDNIALIENGDIVSISGIKLMILDDYLNILGDLKYARININSLHVDEIIHKKLEDIKITEKKEDDVELYKESDYFYCSPRIIEKIPVEEISIDMPSKKNDSDNTNQIFSLFSSAGMAIISVLTIILTFSTLKQNKTELIQRVATTSILLCSMIAIPIIRVCLKIKKRNKKEKNRQIAYKKYINSKIMEINEVVENQDRIIKENNMIADECERIVLEKSHKLWERQIEDEDFLCVNLGNGDKEIDIGIDKVEPKFIEEPDNLLDIYYDVVNSSRIISGMPISISLANNNVVSIISKEKNKIKEYMQNIILQLVSLQNFRTLKLVFLVKNIDDWDFVRMIPHVWDDANSIRFLASSRNEINEVTQYLDEQLLERIPEDTDNFKADDISYKDFDTYYVVFTDNYRKLNDIRLLDRIVNSEQNYGFSLVNITNDIRQAPNKCKAFIEIENDSVHLLLNEASETVRKKIKLDKFEKVDYGKISRVISNIPIKYTSSKALALPKHYNFMEMYDSGNIEQLNILNRWSSNDSTKSLQAQIGIDAMGNAIYLDAHEKYHGPHGLIAGTTGSGKSEFIITYILSLAINYHPDDVTFILIDYKGGGLAGAFKKKDVQLPHLVGTITNIDSVGIQRSLESIQSELRRRQIKFNEAKNITNESTIDIYKYQRFYHEGVLKEPISHLFIICDEFAELKQQQPDFMAELMSVSRIGRSLGVHLILATQKPSGVVNEQIRSNSKFGICLKVQNKSDSKDIIGKPDAALLKNAGQFYINVGNDEYFALGQSGYTGVPYVESDIVKKEENNAIEFISNIGSVIKKVDDNEEKNEDKTIENKGDQLTNIVNYLDDLAKRKNIHENSLWLEPIPENIYISKLRKKYNVIAEKNIINPIIGEYDDPFNQRQDILTLNLSNDGNTIIYGSNDSGKELVMFSVLYDAMITHTSEEVQFYLIDFGNEILTLFRDAPNVGDVMLVDDVEKIVRMFTMIKKEMKRRKQMLIDYNGSYKLYLKTGKEPMPMIVVMINDFGNFFQLFIRQEEELNRIFKNCNKYGIVFIITANAYNEVRTRTSQNFKRKLTLQLLTNDYSVILSKAKRKKPSNLYGRGLCTVDDDTVYEFQTAKMFLAENINESMKKFIDKLKKKNKLCAPKIPVVPKVVNIEDVKSKLKDLTCVPIGISTRNIEPYLYNFKKDIVTIITAIDVEKTTQFVSALIKEIKMLNNVDIVLFDEEELVIKSEDGFVNRFNKMTERINNNYTNREKNDILYIIIGIGKFLDKLGSEKERFTSNLNGAKLAGNCNFIVIDNASKIKNSQIDSWYRRYVNQGTGVYIGSGFDTQTTIQSNIEKREITSICKDSFGYASLRRKSTFIKLLGVIDEEENDE